MGTVANQFGVCFVFLRIPVLSGLGRSWAPGRRKRLLFLTSSSGNHGHTGDQGAMWFASGVSRRKTVIGDSLGAAVVPAGTAVPQFADTGIYTQAGKLGYQGGALKATAAR